MTGREFQPLVAGAHAQTVLGQVVRSALMWPYRSEDVIVDAGVGVRLLLRASWQREPRDHPTLLLVHGLEGSDRARYLISTGIFAFRRGWNVVRMNMRGCGDGLELCPRLYNAGLTSDLLAVFSWFSSRAPRFALCGFSLGAGLSLLTLGREKRSLSSRLLGAVAICPPLDMSRAADALELPGNRFYGRRFTRSLCRSYRKRQVLSDGSYEKGRERRLRTLRQFDDVVTAYYAGYDDAEHYYREVSAGPWLQAIGVPTLVIAADNDPFIPVSSVEHWPRSASVQLSITRGAGHVGFIGRTRAPRFFWAGERAIDFLDEIRARP